MDGIGEFVVRMLSYNIFLRPPGIHEKNSSDHKNKRLKVFLEHYIDEWDIVAFQELFGTFSKRRHKLIKRSKEDFQFHYHVESPMPHPLSKHIVDGGLVIISKFPIIDSDYHVYTESAASDTLSAKGVLYAKIELRGDLIIHCFTTHLQASYSNRPEDTEKFIAIRRSQILELLDFVQMKTVYDYRPIFLLGDMNTNMNMQTNALPEYHQMMQLMGSSYFIPVDILYQIYGNRPITGFSEEVTKLRAEEAQLDNPSSWRSLDYILLLVRKERSNLASWQIHDLENKEVAQPSDHKYIQAAKKKIVLTTYTGVHCEICGSVEPFFCPACAAFCALSDHFGVSATFVIRKL